jgi:tetratricopeptide (TPR) repeat protein
MITHPTQLSGFMKLLPATCFGLILAGSLSKGEGQGFDWSRVTAEPPAGLVETAETKRESVIILKHRWPAPTVGKMTSGFFVSGDGLAICPLLNFCKDGVSTNYEAYDGSALRPPDLIAVYGDLELALLRFPDKPAAWLEFAEQKPASPSWLVMLSNNRMCRPLPGQIFRYNRGSNSSMPRPKYKEPWEIFTVVAGGSPLTSSSIIFGAPMLDSSGRVVAFLESESPFSPTYAGKLRTGRPLTGLGARIEASSKNQSPVPIPVPMAQHPYDPAYLDPLRTQAAAVFAAGNPKEGFEKVDALVRKYPDSRYARRFRFYMMRSDRLNASQPLEKPTLEEIIKQGQLADDEHPVNRCYHLIEVAQSQTHSGDWTSGLATYRAAIEAAPEDAGLAYANLGHYALFKEKYEDAAAHYLRATELMPSRIDFHEKYQTALQKLGKWDEEAEVSDRILLLERLFAP